MKSILHDSLPVAAWMDPALARLPGVRPLAPQDWLIRDECFNAQMAYRDHLLATRRAEVFQSRTEAGAELLAMIVDALDDGYEVRDTHITRPDGITVDLRADDPLVTAARLVQEDLCLMEQMGDEHVLTGAVLCFPASWSLAEKFGHPLTHIHGPVQNYTEDIARRVQRLFNGLQVGRPLWRANALRYDDPDLFQPRRTDARRAVPSGASQYIRAERQSLLRLAQSRAICFSIHTYVCPLERLSREQSQGLTANPIIHAMDPN